MEKVRCDHAFTFKYSERPQTYAERKFEDDVSEDVKQRRLEEIITLQRQHANERNERELGSVHTVLIDGPSKKSDAEFFGRTDTNKGVVFPWEDYEKGQYVRVRIDDCTSSTLLGTALETTTLAEAAETDTIVA